MAQLVKLLDYVSRYESDLSRYPTQYIRLKRYQWERMKTQWENRDSLTEWEQMNVEVPIEPEIEKWFSPITRLFSKRTTEEERTVVEENPVEVEGEFDFSPKLNYSPSNLKQLRKHYLEQLFQFQLKWASSTLTQKSKLDLRYMRDPLLRSFAQLLPDNYLLFYYPILKVKKAPVELDILIVTPVECMCITVLEQESMAAFVDTGDRFWLKKIGNQETKLLNPMISLNRMEKIVDSIFKNNDVNFPIKKYLISRNGYIDRPGKSFDATVVDRRTYENWFTALKESPLPLKSMQFKAAQSILDVGQTTAMSSLFDHEEEQKEN